MGITYYVVVLCSYTLCSIFFFTLKEKIATKVQYIFHLGLVNLRYRLFRKKNHTCMEMPSPIVLFSIISKKLNASILDQRALNRGEVLETIVKYNK